MRTFYSFLTVLLLCSPAVGREVVVDNVAGDDRFTGQTARDPGGMGGPVRTLAKALRLAGPGDTIVLVKNDAPYRESFSLTGSRHSGTKEQPFTIRGNGAILDGSAPAPAEKWEAYQGAIFRLRGRPTGYSQLFLERPAGGAGVRRAIGQEPAEIGAPAMVLARRAHLFLRRKEQTARRL